MGIKPGLQARAGAECRARPTDAAITLPRGSAPSLHHQSGYQAIKSAFLIDPFKDQAHNTGSDRCSARSQGDRSRLFVACMDSRRGPQTVTTNARNGACAARVKDPFRGVPPFCVDNPIIKGKIRPYEGAIHVIWGSDFGITDTYTIFWRPCGKRVGYELWELESSESGSSRPRIIFIGNS